MQKKTPEPIDELWRAADERLPHFSLPEQRAGIALLTELSQGEPVASARLAQAMGVAEAEANHYIQDSSLSPFVYSNEDGAAVGFAGLSTLPTEHRLSVYGRTVWAWCAVDTLFLPELVDATATVESKDPVTEEPITLTVSPAAVESVQPSGAQVSMNSPAAWETTSAVRLIVTACHYIHFLGSPRSVAEWKKTHRDSAFLPLDRAFEYGKRQNQRMFGAALAERASQRT